MRPHQASDTIIGEIAKDKLPSDVVYAGELAGSETDRYASYNNAMISNSYRSGDWVLTSDLFVAPTAAKQIGQPDIVTGFGTIVLGRLRTDANPDTVAWAPVPSASDYSNGDVIYASLDRDKGSYLRIDILSNPTLVGTGDAAYIWATANWTETGNIANVQDAGDYFKLAAEEPTSLQIEIPASDVLGLIDYITSKVTDAPDPIDGTTKLMLADLTGLSIDHLERHFADRYKSFGNFSIVASSAYDAKGEIDASQLNNANKKIRIAVPDAVLTDFGNDIISGMLVELYRNSTNYLIGRVDSVTSDSLRTAINGRYINLTTLDSVGSVGAGHTAELRLYVQGDGLVPVPESTDVGRVLKATGVNAYGWGDGPGIIGHVDDLTETYTQIISSTDWSALPNNAVLEFTVLSPGDNYKNYPGGKFLKSDVTTSDRWLGNVEDYDSGARIMIKTVSGAAQVRRAGTVPADNVVRLWRIG